MLQAKLSPSAGCHFLTFARLQCAWLNILMSNALDQHTRWVFFLPSPLSSWLVFWVSDLPADLPFSCFPFCVCTADRFEGRRVLSPLVWRGLVQEHWGHWHFGRHLPRHAELQPQGQHHAPRLQRDAVQGSRWRCCLGHPRQEAQRGGSSDCWRRSSCSSQEDARYLLLDIQRMICFFVLFFSFCVNQESDNEKPFFFSFCFFFLFPLTSLLLKSDHDGRSLSQINSQRRRKMPQENKKEKKDHHNGFDCLFETRGQTGCNNRNVIFFANEGMGRISGCTSLWGVKRRRNQRPQATLPPA